MSPVPATEPPPGVDGWTGTAHDRTTYRALRAERAQLVHWRRLLRARLDLVVAGLAPPERLGAFTSDLLPNAVAGLPGHADLCSAVNVTPLEDTVDLMNRIRTMDRALREYTERIDIALDDLTRGVVRDLADTPPEYRETRTDTPSSAAHA